MPSARLTPLALVLPLALACEERAPAPAAAPPVEIRSESGPNRAELQEKLRPWLSRRDERPKKLSEQACPDEVISAATDEGQRAIALRAQDARWEKRSLIPLRVTAEVTFPDPPSLESALIRHESRLDPKLLEQIEWLSERKYVGVFHVLDYAAPRVIQRVGRAKPEWVAGWVLAWLSVHDARSGEPMCATQLHVKNDVSQAPLTKQRRSEITEQLTSALGRQLREAAPSALSKISKVLYIDAGEQAVAASARNASRAW